jgi:hypothetical protein
MTVQESKLPYCINPDPMTLPSRLREAVNQPTSPDWPNLDRKRLLQQADDIEASLKETQTTPIESE